MLRIQEHVNLQPFNTFAIPVTARYFCEVTSEAELISLCSQLTDYPRYMVLGGGSNVLFCNHYDGLIIHNRIQGISFEAKNQKVHGQFGGGENWHECVLRSVEQGLYGIENLSLIPGTVGAAPVQNIGAYGVEIKDVFVSLRAVNLIAGNVEIFNAERCQFDYRDSVFKQAEAGKFCITEVTLSLDKAGSPKAGYGELSAELAQCGISAEDATPKQMSNAVCTIRKRKLPDPSELPNAGSFFKNPIVSADKHQQLKQSFPDMVSYALPNGEYKLACGWLIDAMGWKGKLQNGAQIHQQQALVLINRGGGAEAICNFANDIKAAVYERYGVTIESEPGWIS
ncbi:MAG: UDP-N-acetylmuramate dehydrogenase [Pseudomonadales bacterium]|nr:UDP-N-acetylmuramate dehydrogenase [Pseudomonadales bacterium]